MKAKTALTAAIGAHDAAEREWEKVRSATGGRLLRSRPSPADEQRRRTAAEALIDAERALNTASAEYQSELYPREWGHAEIW